MRVFYVPKRKIIPALLLIALLAVSSFAYALTEDEKKIWQKDGNVIWQVKTDEKVVAITFEDGPDEKFTPFVLDLLKEHQAKATFFIVGYKAKEHPELIKRIKEEGHEIENHSMTHPNLLKLSAQSIESQIKMAAILIEKATGKKPKYFRPPQGKINKQLVNISKDRGHKIVLWNLTPGDFPYTGVLPKDTTVADLIPSGSIITLKDDDNYKQETLRALNFILISLTNEKYKFVTVDELVNLKDAKINEEITRPKEQPPQDQQNPNPNPNNQMPNQKQIPNQQTPQPGPITPNQQPNLPEQQQQSPEKVPYQ